MLSVRSSTILLVNLIFQTSTDLAPCGALSTLPSREGYSFNTVLNDDGQDLRDSLRVRRSGDDIKIQSGKTLAKVGTNGAKVCEVRMR